MSQTRIKSFPALQLNPRKLRMYLSIALICTPFYTNAIELCTTHSHGGEWAIADNGNSNISADSSMNDSFSIFKSSLTNKAELSSCTFKKVLQRKFNYF